MKNNKIIGISPCYGWATHKETEIKRKIVAIGLYDNGKTVFLEVTKYGAIAPVDVGNVVIEV